MQNIACLILNNQAAYFDFFEMKWDTYSTLHELSKDETVKNKIFD